MDQTDIRRRMGSGQTEQLGHAFDLPQHGMDYLYRYTETVSTGLDPFGTEYVDSTDYSLDAGVFCVYPLDHTQFAASDPQASQSDLAYQLQQHESEGRRETEEQ